jgi:hypothetical protein
MEFINPNDPEGLKTRQTLANWVLQFWLADTLDSISFTELDCADPGCVVKETLIHFEKNGHAVTKRIHKPLVFLRKSDFID